MLIWNIGQTQKLPYFAIYTSPGDIEDRVIETIIYFIKDIYEIYNIFLKSNFRYDYLYNL